MFDFLHKVLISSPAERFNWFGVAAQATLVVGVAFLLIVAFFLWVVAPTYQKNSVVIQSIKSSSKDGASRETLTSTDSQLPTTQTNSVHKLELNGTKIEISKLETLNIYFPGGQDVKVPRLHVVTPEGGTADIETYLLFDRAAWAYGEFNKFLDEKGRAVDLSVFFEGDEFTSRAKEYDAIVCLGLLSSQSRTPLKQTLHLADDRAVHLCGMISRSRGIDLNHTKIFGLPLGYHKKVAVKKKAPEERRQRGVILIGIKASSRDLKDEGSQHKMIAAILSNDSIEGFQSSAYSEVDAKAPLRYIQIHRGTFAARP